MKTSQRVFAVVMGLILLVTMSSFAFAQEKPKDTYTLPASMGAVTFNHAAHLKAADNKCETCHHKAEGKKADATNKSCRSCHAKPDSAVKLKDAMHNAGGTAGTCVDCHKKTAKGPAKPGCTGCHTGEKKAATAS